VRQLLAQGILAATGEYGTLGLTDAAAAVLNGSRSVQLRTEPDRPARSAAGSRGSRGGARAAAADLSPVQAERFEALRAWRAEQAREQGVPAYIVFGDATLAAVAAAQPATLADLGGISGIGAKKLDAYGQALLDVVART
jgi:ATP-dependent DNA helicase RecQ